MEFDELFGGLTELYTGMEKEKFDSLFHSSDIGVIENNNSDITNADNNVVIVDMQEQDPNDDTLLDEDLDEVMENFQKRNEQIGDEKIISQEDRDALTFAALCEIEQTLALDGDDEVKEEEKGGKENPIDVEQYEAAAFGSFITSSGGASWRTPSAVGLHPRYHEASWNSRNVNPHVSAPFSGQSLSRPGPWSHGLLGRTSTRPSFISSSSSSGCNPSSILLGGLVDVSSYRSLPTSSKNNTSWNNLHGLTLEHPSSLSSPFSSSSFSSSSLSSPFSSSNLSSSFLSSPFSSSYLSSTFLSSPYSSTFLSSPFSSSSLSSSSYPPTQLNAIPEGESSFGCGSVKGAIPQKRPEEAGVGPSPQMSRFENLMEKYKRVCNMSKTVVGSGTSQLDRRSRRRRAMELADLPPGLEIVRRVRQNGKSKGQIDTYYINKTTNQRYRSLVEVRRCIIIN